ncbi:MAG TPA: ABC transporter substrate-binding protein, partial [Candidatus Saccharimonadales bacterium]|nr:ABC transporter substrate-binding protein [Candidatus Saccharimonadales bacterium]
GLDVSFKEYQDGLDQTAFVATGGADFGISTAMEIIPSIANGNDVIALGAIHQLSPQAFASLTKEHISTPLDFKGKILGAKGGNQQAIVAYKALLNQYGLNDKVATIKNLDYSVDVDGDLLQHRSDMVDLYRTDEPYIFQKKGISYTLLLPENFGFKTYGDVLITSNAMLKSNHDIVAGFVKATFAGWQYALSHKEEALTVTKKYQNASYADPAKEKYILEQSIPLILTTGGRQLGTMDYVVWNQSVKQLQNAGIINNGFDVTKMYTNKFLQ